MLEWRSSVLSVLLQVLHEGACEHMRCLAFLRTGAIETTRASLHFATCAKSVQMRPRVNKIVDSKAQIKQLMEETAWLKKQLVCGDAFVFERAANV